MVRVQRYERKRERQLADMGKFGVKPLRGPDDLRQRCRIKQNIGRAGYEMIDAAHDASNGTGDLSVGMTKTRRNRTGNCLPDTQGRYFLADAVIHSLKIGGAFFGNLALFVFMAENFAQGKAAMIDGDQHSVRGEFREPLVTAYGDDVRFVITEGLNTKVNAIAKGACDQRGDQMIGRTVAEYGKTEWGQRLPLRFPLACFVEGAPQLIQLRFIQSILCQPAQLSARLPAVIQRRSHELPEVIGCPLQPLQPREIIGIHDRAEPKYCVS